LKTTRRFEARVARHYNLAIARGPPNVNSPEADYYRLRTEWLRYKSHLMDRLTGLPTLPAVIEEVRRLIESAGGADVVYLDLGRSGWHETKLGWAAYDDAIRTFARRLIGLRESGALDASDVLCLHTVRSDRFLVFRGVPADGSLGRDAGSALRQERLLEALRGPGGPEQPPELRLASGHARVRSDPMVRSERAIQQAVSDAMLMSLRAREGLESARREDLQRLIVEERVRTVFHPILRLADRGTIGHEALTRPIGVSGFDSVEEMFAFAESTDLRAEFERLCRTTAIRAAAGLSPRGLLFLNASARAVEDPDWANGSVDAELQRSGLRPHEVVIELTERLAVSRHDSFGAILRAFKERGYRVAVDDMGAGYASLQSLASIEPDFLKFDVSLVRDIHLSSIKRGLLQSLSALAEKIRARVIAEGVESERERETLLALGIELGQGFLFHPETPSGNFRAARPGESA
jgi:EAL domain-containing protein (putative c-di-GMP-specific phosphodiesterase class I)